MPPARRPEFALYSKPPSLMNHPASINTAVMRRATARISRAFRLALIARMLDASRAGMEALQNLAKRLAREAMNRGSAVQAADPGSLQPVTSVYVRCDAVLEISTLAGSRMASQCEMNEYCSSML
jgi:hypothetical protein